MANELTYGGISSQTGLNISVTLHSSDGQVQQSNIPASEVYPSVYVASMPTNAPADKYLVRFFDDDENVVLGQGEIFWDGNKEIVISQSEAQERLDNYTNKDDWKADVSNINMQPVLDAIQDVQDSVNDIELTINSLNDLSLSDIEGSTVLAKEAKQDAIQNTANSIVSLINALNDLSAEDVWTYVTRTLTSSGSITPEQDELIKRAADFAEKAAMQTEKTKRK